MASPTIQRLIDVAIPPSSEPSEPDFTKLFIPLLTESPSGKIANPILRAQLRSVWLQHLLAHGKMTFSDSGSPSSLLAHEGEPKKSPYGL